MWGSLLNSVLGLLSGFYFVSALVGILVGRALWYFLGVRIKDEQRRLNCRFTSVGVVIVLWLLGSGIYSVATAPDYEFADVTGILILRIEGDDALQDRLVSEFNNQLSRDSLEVEIEVLRHQAIVSEGELGLPGAHEQARHIGAETGAHVVIWGRVGKERAYYPRFTLVQSVPSLAKEGAYTLAAQDISKITLPPVFLNKAVYVARLVAGCLFYGRSRYEAALRHLEAATSMTGAQGSIVPDIQAMIGLCRVRLARGGREVALRARPRSSHFDLPDSARTYGGGLDARHR